MFFNSSSLCTTKLLNINNGRLSLIKKNKNIIVTLYQFSRCRNHAIKSNEAPLPADISQEANANAHILWHLNKQEGNLNSCAYFNSPLKIPLQPDGEIANVKTETKKRVHKQENVPNGTSEDVHVFRHEEAMHGESTHGIVATAASIKKAVSVAEKDILTEKKRRNGKTIHKNEIFILLRKHVKIYCELSKLKLTLSVALSSCFGQHMLGDPCFLKCSTLLTGVFFCSCSANTFNQICEKELDKLMSRTKRRPLPNNKISVRHAVVFGFTAAVVGTLTLWYYSNLLTAALGLFNILLYVLVYTPLKTKTPYNTHIGSVVGSIPTLMGCTSAVPNLFLAEPWMLFFTQLLWQFPHFYSLAYLYKDDYLRGNYKMFPLKDTSGKYTAKLCRPHLITLSLLPFFFFSLGYAPYSYMLTSLIPNAFIYYKFHKFAKFPSRQNIRSFFKHSLWHIIILLALLAYHKKCPGIKEIMSDGMHSDKEKETENYENVFNKDIAKPNQNLLESCVVFF